MIIDTEAIENLRSLGDEGDDTFLREIITIYLEDVPLRLADLKTARAAGDRSFYTRSAHTIKGSSSNLGAVEVRTLAETLEHRSRSEPLAELDALASELEGAFQRARAALVPLLG